MTAQSISMKKNKCGIQCLLSVNVLIITASGLFLTVQREVGNALEVTDDAGQIVEIR